MRRLRTIITIAIAGAGMMTISAAGWFGGLRINLTPSEPLGLWRIARLNRPVDRGDLAFVCPPPTDLFERARARGYLRRGICSGDFAPLIKTVAALPGDKIEIGADVTINGRSLKHSTVQASDGEARAIEPFAGGIVQPGHLFLHSPFANSYDSRYFGPVPADGLLGLARPVLTFDP